MEYKRIHDLFESSLKTCISMFEGCNLVGDFVFTPQDFTLPFLKIDTTQTKI